MATTPNLEPPLRDRAAARAQADPSGQNMDHQSGAFSLGAPPSGTPRVTVPVVNDHDADERAGWAGTVRPVSGAPGESGRGF
jgi:hypothetical protein